MNPFSVTIKWVASWEKEANLYTRGQIPRVSIARDALFFKGEKTIWKQN